MTVDLMRPRKGALAIGGVAAAAVLAGCGQAAALGDTSSDRLSSGGTPRSAGVSLASGESSHDNGPAVGESTPIASQPVDDADCQYSTGDKSGDGTASPREPAELTDVELIRREGTGAIRLSFAPGTGTPDYEIGYQPEPLHLEGSGKPVRLEGGTAMAVHLSNAVDIGIATGEVLIDPARQSVIIEVKSLGAFEGYVSLGIGIIGNDRIPFRVVTGENTLTIEFDYGPPENA